MNCFLALSDIHGSRKSLERILSNVPPVDGILLVGDITQKGGCPESDAILGQLAALNPRILGVHGNMDRTGVIECLESRCFSIHGRAQAVGEAVFFGIGGSNHTPFATPTEYSDQEIGRFLREGYEAARDAGRKILISHFPPINTKIDRTWTGFHAGSAVLREFLLAHHDIAVCLCGHIHEASGEDTVGQTRCHNIGAACDGLYALVEFDGTTITVKRSKAN